MRTGVIIEDLLANRPPAGRKGRFFHATDTGEVHLDTGSVWTAMGGGSHPDLAAHDTLGLATQAELNGHGHDATYVNETAEVWNGLTYQNGWADYGSGYQAGQYYRDPLGFVHLRGVVGGGGAGAVVGSVITTLPAGYRPAADEILNGFMVGNTLWRCNVRTTGNVEYGSGTDNPIYISFAHIKFMAA